MPFAAYRGGTGWGSYAQGELLFASTTNALGPLAVGSAGQVLMVSDGLPVWTSTTSPTGTGASGSVARWTGTNTLGAGVLYDTGFASRAFRS